MKSINSLIAVQPQLREYLDGLEVLISGSAGLKWVLTPATVAPIPTSEAWTRTVLVELQDVNGVLQEWYNASITTGVSIADTSTAGTASIASTTLTLVNGRASIVVSGDAADWLDTETDTLTVAEATILGYTVAAKTSVETFTAA